MKARIKRGGITVLVADGKSDDEEILTGFKYIGKEYPSYALWIPAQPGTKFCVHWTCNKEEAKGRRGMVLVCHLYIDGELVEWGHIPATDVIDREKSSEWEISGKFCRGENGGPPQEYPFYFGESESYSSDRETTKRKDVGIILAEVFWARPDTSVQNRYPTPDESFADALREHFEQPRPLRMGDTESAYDRACVRISAQPTPTQIIEQNMLLRPEAETRRSFTFHYAHPDWLRMKGIMKGSPSPARPVEQPIQAMSSRRSPSPERTPVPERTPTPKLTTAPNQTYLPEPPLSLRQPSPPEQAPPPQRTISIKNRMRPKPTRARV